MGSSLTPETPLTRPLCVAVLTSDRSTILALSEALIEAVENGGSLTFLHPLTQELAVLFWRETFAAAQQGDLVVLGALDGSQIVGTVTLRVAWPETQPFRAEILKVITRISHRRRGVAQVLLREAERHALQRQKRLLTLEAAAGSGAAKLYQTLGYELLGILPGGELTAHGELMDTAIYFKRISDDQ